MKKTLILVAVAAAVAIAPALAFPPGPKGGPHRGPGGPMLGPHALPMLAQALGLSDAQREQIQSILEQNAASGPDQLVVERLQGLRDELHSLWQAPEPNRQAILEKMAEMDAVRDSLRDARRERRVDTRLAILEVLTPEQRAELSDLREEMRENRGHRRGGRAAGPCGRRHGGR